MPRQISHDEPGADLMIRRREGLRNSVRRHKRSREVPPMADVRTIEFELPGFGGELLRPGEAAYDEARAVFNAMIDRRPAVIARATSADDVAAAVNVARDQNIALSIYGGGHGVTGSAVVDAGICLDLRGMKGIDID